MPGQSFFQIRQNMYFCSDPISVDPISPQPRHGERGDRRLPRDRARHSTGGAYLISY